jgi:hypothetical protein
MECNPYYEDASWSFYRFKPNVPAPILFAVLFGITTIMHGFQMVRTRTWYMGAFFAGGVCKSPSQHKNLIDFLQY